MIEGIYTINKRTTLAQATSEISNIIHLLGYTSIDERPISYGYQFKVANEGTINIYEKKGKLSKAVFNSVQPKLANAIFDYLQLEREEDKTIEIFNSYVGTDESGKGDVFGPLIVAGMCVNDETKPILKKIKVVDCKQNSDKINEIMAKQIYDDIDPKYYAIIKSPLEKYNKSFDLITNNLAKILADMHGAAIKEISDRVNCYKAIVDKFDNSGNLERRLNKCCPDVQFALMPRAEKFLGVAAASIIARVEYIKNMNILSDMVGFELHKGASELVKKDILRVHSLYPDKLDHFCKMHFRTIGEVLGK